MTDAWRDAPQLVPPAAIERDRILPIILAVSLLLHVGFLIALMSRGPSEPAPLQEIPVELVQLPPEPPRPPPSPPAQPPAPKALPKQAEPSPAPKAPKPEPQKQAEKPARKAAPTTTERMKALLGEPPRGLGAQPDDLGEKPLPGAIVLPGQGADGSITVAYPELVMSQVAKAKKQGQYPGMPGKTVVAFELTETGDPVNIRIDAPSNNPMLDEEAIEMVKRGAPYPPPPPGARRHFAVGLLFKPASP